MAKEVGISIREYGRRLNLSDTAVRKAIAAKLITKGFDKKNKKILPSVADKEWGHQHKVVKSRAGVSRVKAIEKNEKGGPGFLPLPPGELFPEETLEDLLASLKIHSKMAANESMRVREIIGAALDLKKLQEAEGKLVQREKVEKTLFSIANELKKALFNMPQRIVRDIMAAPNEVEAINIFNYELTQVLTDFINIKPNFAVA